ncbi:MAG TPA: Hsp33 family molecular chaperone HslO, partial [Anaeromyxobacteraceae bacterium]|nr:Hsp33 family molecular chaperone HslO [Anaeromyxobacteraceae bacterium]
RARAALEAGACREALAGALRPEAAIAAMVGGPLEIIAEEEVAYRCRCSYERARAAVSALGLGGLRDVLAHERQAVVTCEFCRARYLISEEELREMARRLSQA